MQGRKPDPSIRKALCITADQSTMQRATNHHREAGNGIIPTSHRENKEELL